MTDANALRIPAPRCAAIYVRMSTDKQNYSIDHQREHLHSFASARGLTVVREYGDEGKSGLALKGRPGLRALLADVQSDTVPFQSILVYDVSRWGRFQDVDESAHYEYVCRSAGVDIAYCAESFDNDGSPMAALIKSFKRTMAAEYSRELSAKVFKAQCRFIRMGYKQGGSAGYALRRQVVGPDGALKTELASGQRKGSTTDRVIFTLGPQDEIDTLHRIYSMYIDDGLGETQIARQLNSESIPSEFSRPWTPWMVKSLLTNEKYLGDMVFNRGSFKLQRIAVHNPRDEWVRSAGAFISPLPPAAFGLAQAERARRNRRPDKVQLLQQLRDIHAENGKVTTTILYGIRSTLPKLFARHFGTITNAYFLAGIPTTSSYKYVATRQFVAATRKAVVARCLVECPMGRASQDPHEPSSFLVDQYLCVSVVVARCRGGSLGNARWKIPTSSIQRANFVIAVQLSADNESIEAYYLLPRAAFGEADITLREERLGDLSAYRFSSTLAIFGQDAEGSNGQR